MSGTTRTWKRPFRCNSNTCCAVSGCHSRSGRGKKLSFHRVPVQENRKKAWEQALLRKEPMTASMRVCSLHFTRDSYILPDLPSKRKALKKTAVPSCNLPEKEHRSKSRQETAVSAFASAINILPFVPISVRMADPMDTHFVDVNSLPVDRSCDDLPEPYRCHQCRFVTYSKVALKKHKQFKINPSDNSRQIRIPNFICNSCQKFTSHSAMIMSKHHGLSKRSHQKHRNDSLVLPSNGSCVL